MFPDGRAAKLMSEIQFPCAHCGGAVREPLTLAAKRHSAIPARCSRRSVRSSTTGPDEEQIADAARRRQRDGDRHRAHDVGRPLGRAGRGRGAAPGRRALHGRSRAGAPRAGTRRSSARSSPTPRVTVDPTAALEMPGVAASSRATTSRALEAVPGRDRLAGSAVRRRRRHRPLRRRAARRRRRARPLPRRGRGRARRGRLRPARPRSLDPSTAAEPIHERSFHYGDVDDAIAGADLVVRTTFRMPRFYRARPSSATASSATGTSRRDA